MGLSEGEKEQFRKLGYVIRPGMLSPERAQAVAREIDRYVEVEPRFDGRNIHRYDRLCDLVVDPETLAITDDIMGGAAFTFAAESCHEFFSKAHKHWAAALGTASTDEPANNEVAYGPVGVVSPSIHKPLHTTPVPLALPALVEHPASVA